MLEGVGICSGGQERTCPTIEPTNGRDSISAPRKTETTEVWAAARPSKLRLVRALEVFIVGRQLTKIPSNWVQLLVWIRRRETFKGSELACGVNLLSLTLVRDITGSMEIRRGMV